MRLVNAGYFVQWFDVGFFLYRLLVWSLGRILLPSFFFCFARHRYAGDLEVALRSLALHILIALVALGDDAFSSSSSSPSSSSSSPESELVPAATSEASSSPCPAAPTSPADAGTRSAPFEAAAAAAAEAVLVVLLWSVAVTAGAAAAAAVDGEAADGELTAVVPFDALGAVVAPSTMPKLPTVASEKEDGTG